MIIKFTQNPAIIVDDNLCLSRYNLLISIYDIGEGKEADQKAIFGRPRMSSSLSYTDQNVAIRRERPT